MNTVYHLGSEKHPFIDWELVEAGYGLTWGPEYGGPARPTSWELPVGVQLTVHEPLRIDRRPLVWCDRPWESQIVSYSTLLQDEGVYRLFYECKYKQRLDQRISDSGSMQAYAESADMIAWTKPALGGVSFNGSSENNLLLARGMTMGRDCHGATVFKDPSAPADQRYKMVHMGWDYKAKWDICGAVSPDGLRWKAVEQPLVSDYTSDTQNVMAFDPVKAKYVGYFRGWEHGRRRIAYAESETFANFPTPQLVVCADAGDAPTLDMYTNGYHRWPGALHAHLMLSTFYERASDQTEVHLLVSRDGVRWQRPSRRPVIPAGQAGSGVEGGVYAGCGIAETLAGEWAIPLAISAHTHNARPFAGGRIPTDVLERGFICLAYWRKDGFMSLHAPSEGKWTSTPVTFSGRLLRVNALTQYGGEILCELASASGEPIAGFTFEECDPISGDAPDHTVTWRGQSNVAALAGQELRLRWRMRRAHLYALQFTS
jgi:hypothetical protein